MIGQAIRSISATDAASAGDLYVKWTLDGVSIERGQLAFASIARLSIGFRDCVHCTCLHAPRPRPRPVTPLDPSAARMGGLVSGCAPEGRKNHSLFCTAFTSAIHAVYLDLSFSFDPRATSQIVGNSLIVPGAY